jgi:MFS family permease
MVLFMPTETYGIDAAGKFFLVAVPTLVGAILRIPYTVATARFGGRNWTVFSAAALLVPAVLTLYFVNQPGTSYTTFLIVAAFAGLGGGNFASSMTNINAFYPQRLKGWALGMNAGGGNIGVPVIQLFGLLVIATLGNEYASVICATYLVLVVLAGLGAALFMDNLPNQKADLSFMLTALKVPQSWAVSFLYIGTFGSFIGYSFAFGQILQISFVAGGDTAAQATLRRQTRRPDRWQPGDSVHLRGHDGRRGGGGLGLDCRGRFGQGVLGSGAGRAGGRVRGAVHPVRPGQRVGHQDHPVGFRRQIPQPGGECGRTRSLGAEHFRRADRIRRRHRCSRRRRDQPGAAVLLLLDPIRDHRLLGVHGVLHRLRPGHLGGVPAPSRRPGP